MPRDTRENASASAVRAAETRNTANASANTGKINTVSRAMRALPAPLNVASQALGNGLYAAMKAPLSPVSNPTPSNDPVKLMAFGLAFAILKAMWCFIKSLLHPMPFIGSYFPLCRNADGASSADNVDLENKALEDAESIAGEAIPDNPQTTTATSSPDGSGTGNNLGLGDGTGVGSGGDGDQTDAGKSFEEYIAGLSPEQLGLFSGGVTAASLGIASSSETATTANPTASGASVAASQGGTDNSASGNITGGTLRNVPPNSAPQWYAESTTYDELRKKFGL